MRKIINVVRHQTVVIIKVDKRDSAMIPLVRAL